MKKITDNKTIAITLRFWTNDICVQHKNKESLSCWNSGVVKIETNSTKKIKSHKPIPFNNMEEILPIIRSLLKKNKILQVNG